MALTALEDLLRTSMGLNAASIGPAAIARAVHERQAICRLADTHAYLTRVLASPAELQSLIEAVVVPETWFFRDGQAFVAMARMAREEWLTTHAAGVMTLLSLPCSTGEEPVLDGDGAARRRCARKPLPCRRGRYQQPQSG